METKIADNYIFESVLDHSIGDSDKTPFVRKNLNYIVDQQAGNSAYTSGQVIIDSTSLASSGNTFQDWSNAYIALPYSVTVSATAVEATGATAPTSAGILNYLSSLKNNSLIDSITVEQAGKTIINQTSNLSQLVNFKMHSTFSQDNVNKMGGSLLYAPDTPGAYTYTASSVGVVNNLNLPTNTANWDKPESYNSGVLKRQQLLCPYTTAITTTTKQSNEADVLQVATGTVPITTAALVTFSEHHFLATIRLKDLCDYFDKHPRLTRGIGYKIYLRVNQGTTTFTHIATTAGTTPFSALAITAQSFTPLGSCLTQPAMVHVGANTLSASLTWANNVTISADTLKLTSAIDTGTNARINGVRLYVPSYECSPSAQAKLMAQPVLHRPFFDIYSNVIQNQLAGGYINTQIASGISSPKALIVVPQIAQAVNSFNSQGSALNPCPGCTDPQISLTSTQIKVGSQYILPDRINYDFVQFLENNVQLFSLNGNQTNALNSGNVDMTKFRHNYRYYAFDLSRYLDSQDSIPQMITFESFNNSSVAVDLYVYVLWERNGEFSLEKGAVQVE